MHRSGIKPVRWEHSRRPTRVMKSRSFRPIPQAMARLDLDKLTKAVREVVRSMAIDLTVGTGSSYACSPFGWRQDDDLAA